MDRDENIAGVPIFAQLAGGLADAGYYVLRYDKRGLARAADAKRRQRSTTTPKTCGPR